MKAYCLIGMQQYEESILYNEEILDNYNYDYVIWYNIGIAHYEIENFAKAKSSFVEAIKLNPNVYQSWTNKGTCEIKLKQYDNAINSFIDALKLNINSKDVWHGKGIAHQMIKENLIAIECFEKALSIDPMFERSNKRRNELLNQYSCNYTTYIGRWDSVNRVSPPRQDRCHCAENQRRRW